MSGHTPWITGGDSDPTAILCSENYNQIAAVNDALDGWNGHAHLISAAPELLEALVEIMDQTGGYVPDTAKSTWANARAAIAKATGAQA